ncbi:MAG: hypothetical protein ACJATS_002087, partial [Psychroserpens sp.]
SSTNSLVLFSLLFMTFVLITSVNQLPHTVSYLRTKIFFKKKKQETYLGIPQLQVSWVRLFAIPFFNGR